MTLLVLSYLAGADHPQPVHLPVLPFVFARADRPFLQSGLLLLIGMAATFAGVATLAAVGGGWAVQANRYGRTIALVVLALFGLLLLLPSMADRITRPVVALGYRLSRRSDGGAGRNGFGTSLLLGVATGLLYKRRSSWLTPAHISTTGSINIIAGRAGRPELEQRYRATAEWPLLAALEPSCRQTHDF